MVTSPKADPAPFTVLRENGRAEIIITCDHASHATPAALGTLGLSEEQLHRHIGWDIGAADIARYLSTRFDAPAIFSGVSRLVIDCNRALTDPASIPEVSDGVTIPANVRLSEVERRQRQANWFWPYHESVDRIVQGRLAAGRPPVIVSVHSMTDRMRGKFRPWEIALSSHVDRRLTDPVLAALRATPDLVVGDNEPYNLDPAEDYSTPSHALRHGLHHVQVEFRQDCVATRAGAERYAAIFAAALEAGLAAIGHRQAHHA